MTVPSIVRSSQDRRLLGQEKSLYKYLEEQPCEGTYTVQLLAEPRRGQTAREALLAVRVARVEIRHWYRLARSYKRCNTRGSTNQANLE
jgi:hypothetical protein